MIRVVRAGWLTTVQDLGRTGARKYGLGAGGAMDRVACRIANLLVGNEESAAVLEITLGQTVLECAEDTWIAVCGADLSATVDGQVLPLWRPVWLPAGSQLAFAGSRTGCRAYVAFRGGIDLPPVLGSRSTDLRARIGGVEGRPLRAGDELPLGDPAAPAPRQLQTDVGQPRGGVRWPNWFVSAAIWRSYVGRAVLRAVPGRDFRRLDEFSRSILFGGVFTVSPAADRMGYRLTGERLTPIVSGERLSEAVAPGTLQLPAGGEPILLMADAQTTGGYPCVLHVIAADLPAAAQLRPGDGVRFVPVTVVEAQMAMRDLERTIQCLRRVLAGWE